MKKLRLFVLLSVLGAILVGCAEKPIQVDSSDKGGKAGGKETDDGLYK